MTKYNSRKVTIDGIRFDSKEEARYYELLKHKRASGEILNYELQPKYELQPAFKRDGKTVRAICYIGDFMIYHNDGSEEVIEIKGYPTETALLKRKLLMYRYPDLKLTWLSRSIKWGDADGWIEYDELKKRRKAK